MFDVNKKLVLFFAILVVINNIKVFIVNGFPHSSGIQMYD